MKCNYLPHTTHERTFTTTSAARAFMQELDAKGISYTYYSRGDHEHRVRW